jgi:hypothetical protein
MRCEYTVSLADFRESLKGYRKVSSAALIGYRLYVWILPMICLAASAICFMLLLRRGGESFFWPVALGLGFGFGLPARYQMGIKRALKQRDALTQGKPVALEFDDEAIRLMIPGGTEIKYQWNTFTHYFENERVLVLLVKDAAFHTISKRESTEACIPLIRERLNQFARAL